jgi:hypothetical protein
MLTSLEIDDLQAVLTEVLSVQGRNWLKTVFAGPAFFTLLSEEIGPAASDTEAAAGAIRVCIRRDWQEDPCWLLRLVQTVDAESGNNGISFVANAGQIILRLQQKINVLDERWYDQWLQSGVPFLYRPQLRDSLRELARVTGRPILRIDGAPDSGKSYSNELLQHVSQSNAWNFEVIPIEVGDGMDLAINALTLSQQIVGEMGFKNGVSDSPLADPTVHNIPLLVTWILQSARNSNKQWWLFLDGFRFLSNKNSARALIQGLADKIANGAHKQWLRLVLIDYDEALVKVDEEKVAYDVVPPAIPAAKAQREVENCLNALYRQIGRSVTTNEVQAKAAAVIANIPANKPWMMGLNTLVKAAAKGIRNGH